MTNAKQFTYNPVPENLFTPCIWKIFIIDINPQQPQNIFIRIFLKPCNKPTLNAVTNVIQRNFSTVYNYMNRKLVSTNSKKKYVNVYKMVS